MERSNNSSTKPSEKLLGTHQKQDDFSNLRMSAKDRARIQTRSEMADRSRKAFWDSVKVDYPN